jgi:hypothetical protein
LVTLAKDVTEALHIRRLLENFQTQKPFLAMAQIDTLSFKLKGSHIRLERTRHLGLERKDFIP